MTHACMASPPRLLAHLRDDADFGHADSSLVRLAQQTARGSCSQDCQVHLSNDSLMGMLL